MNKWKQLVEALLLSQKREWELARTNYAALSKVQTKRLDLQGYPVILQYNPERIRSSAAKIDRASLQKRPCFFCNRAQEQKGLSYNGDFQLLVNPYPIFGEHLTVPLQRHEVQQILSYYKDMLSLASDLEDFVVFYNGPNCGASAPDHMHFQATRKGALPIEENYKNASKEMVWQGNDTELYTLAGFITSVFILVSCNLSEAVTTFNLLYAQLDVKENAYEPMMNVVTWKEGESWISCIFPRKELRPSCFYAEGEANILLSPAIVEMAGFFVVPLEKDFQKVTARDLEIILKEVSISEEEKNKIVCKIKQQL